MNNTTKRIFLAVACCGFLAILYSADRIPIVAGDPDGPMQTGDTAAFVGPIKADGYEQTTRQNLQVDPRTGLSIDDPYVDLDIDELTTTTLVAGDYLAFADTSDSGNPKKGLVSDIITAASAAILPDGDKGDITVSSSGTVWNIDAGAVGSAELADNVSFLNVSGPAGGDGLTISTNDGATPVATFGAGPSTDTSFAGAISLGTDLTVPNGGTGASTLTGYVKGSGTSALTASSTIPNTDITGLGTMSTQNANSVAITGGSINGTTIGASTASTGSFTTLATSSTFTSGGNIVQNAFTLDRSNNRIIRNTGSGRGYISFNGAQFMDFDADNSASSMHFRFGRATSDAGTPLLTLYDFSNTNTPAIQFSPKVGSAIFNEQGLSTGDFRIEGDTDANLFFSDASADRVGIGTNAPAALFDVDGEARISILGIGGAATGALSTQNNVVVFNETGDANGDFRVESDNVTSMLYVDAGADRVGVGTSSPVQELHVEGEIFVGSISPILIDIDNDDTADAGIYVGDASPEGAITAKPGSLFLNTSGGAGSTLYVKESGTGNTGWVAK